MRLPKCDALDDVDVESCLANLHRIEDVGFPQVMLDLTSPAQSADEVVDVDAPMPARRRQPLSAR